MKSDAHPSCYLILFNIAKRENLGFLVRTANAFGVTEILVVGRRDIKKGGACGALQTTRIRHFVTLDQAIVYVRDLGCSICGIEILDEACPVDARPFRGSTAFMLGNEGSGLTAKQRSHCDYSVYIPQFGSPECLNVNVATGIVLHQFASWAGFIENAREGSKFVPVAESLPVSNRP